MDKEQIREINEQHYQETHEIIQNIFDKEKSDSVVTDIKNFLKRHRTSLLYILFGGFAFFLNIFLFVVLGTYTTINEHANNIICWIICVLFQFFTNRNWVFNAHVGSKRGFLKQLAAFFTGRLFTLFVEEAIIGVFITWLSLPITPIKLLAQIAVIVLNYIIMRWFVFKKKK